MLFCCSIAQEEVLGNIEEPNINGADAVDISDKEDDTINDKVRYHTVSMIDTTYSYDWCSMTWYNKVATDYEL